MVPCELFPTTRLSWRGLIFSTQNGLSLTFTLRNLGSSCSINAIVFISVLMEMQEHSSDCDMPAIRQEAPGEKWKSVDWILSLQKCSKQRLSGGYSGEKYFWRKRHKSQDSTCFHTDLFQTWQFWNNLQSKLDIMAKYLHSILSWFVLQNRNLSFAQLKTHKKAKLKMWLSTKPPLADIVT